MKNEHLSMTTVQDYVNSWRLATALDDASSYIKVLDDFNLLEFKDFDGEELQSLKSTACINFCLAYERNEDGIEGVIATVILAEKYLKLMAFAISNLYEIYKKSQNDSFVLTDKLNDYINYCRLKNEYKYSTRDNKKFLIQHVNYSMQHFAKNRDILLKKGETILKSSAVILSVSIVKW